MLYCGFKSVTQSLLNQTKATDKSEGMSYLKAQPFSSAILFSLWLQV